MKRTPYKICLKKCCQTKVMQKVLDENGFKDQYTLQSFGTSDLGSKLLAEGKNIEADLVTMSTFYLKSAQESQQMFQTLETNLTPLSADVDFAAPFSVQEGSIFYNTDALAEANLPVPTSLKDLADPKYAGMISISDIKQSSTAWLLFPALIDAYGKERIFAKFYSFCVHFQFSFNAHLYTYVYKWVCDFAIFFVFCYLFYIFLLYFF